MTEIKSKPQLHYSALNMLFRCGEQFRRRYIENQIIPPGVALIIGQATDHTVNKNLQHKIDTKGELLTIEEIEDIARDQVNNMFQSEVHLDDDEIESGISAIKGKTIDMAVALSGLHARELAPVIQPTHIQRQWVIELDGYPVDLAGTIDIQEGEQSIRDTKTKGKSPVADEAEKSDQLTMYAMAINVLDGKIPDHVYLDFLIKNKTPIVKTLSSIRTEKDFKPLLARIENAIQAIDKGIFVPINSDNWLCSQKFCGYFRTCSYSRKSVII